LLKEAGLEVAELEHRVRLEDVRLAL
jgi:hypothetical protein